MTARGGPLSMTAATGFSGEPRMKTLASFLLLLFIVPAVYGQSQQTMPIKLYFPNTKLSSDQCEVKVFPVTRRIPRTAAAARGVFLTGRSIARRWRRQQAHAFILLLRARRGRGDQEREQCRCFGERVAHATSPVRRYIMPDFWSK